MNLYVEGLDGCGVNKVALKKLLGIWNNLNIKQPIVFEEILKIEKPLLLRGKQVATGDNVMYRFCKLAYENGYIPMVIENHKDNFQSVSRPKMHLVYPRDLSRARHKMTNPDKWNGKNLNEIIFHTGEKMIDFHRDLWNEIPGEKYAFDFSDWAKQFKSSKEYYPHLMAIYAILGVLTWDFSPEDNPQVSKGSNFNEEVVIPAFYEVQKMIGIKPKILKFSYQKDDELYPNLKKEV